MGNNFDNLPPELKTQGLFCCWKYEDRDGKKKGYTQAQLANKAGLTKTTICNIENGKQTQLYTLMNICNVLNCSLDTLTGQIETSNHNVDYICKYTGLSEQTTEFLHYFNDLIKIGRTPADTINDLVKSENALNIISSYLEIKTPDKILYQQSVQGG